MWPGHFIFKKLPDYPNVQSRLKTSSIRMMRHKSGGFNCPEGKAKLILDPQRQTRKIKTNKQKDSLGKDNTQKQDTVYLIQPPFAFSSWIGCSADTGRGLPGSSEARQRRKSIAGDETEKVDVHALLSLTWS